MATSSIPYFKSWLIFIILSTLLAMGVGMVAGFILGFAMGMVGTPIERIQQICAIAGLLLGFVVSFIVFRWVVDTFIVPAIATTSGGAAASGFAAPPVSQERP